jgi:hypothetical protein
VGLKIEPLAKLLFIDDGSECDICDNKGLVAHIKTLSPITVDICKECLKNILKEMDDRNEKQSTNN